MFNWQQSFVIEIARKILNLRPDLEALQACLDLWLWLGMNDDVKIDIVGSLAGVCS
jgi:hypothetical protein